MIHTNITYRDHMIISRITIIRRTTRIMIIRHKFREYTKNQGLGRQLWLDNKVPVLWTRREMHNLKGSEGRFRQDEDGSGLLSKAGYKITPAWSGIRLRRFDEVYPNLE